MAIQVGKTALTVGRLLGHIDAALLKMINAAFGSPVMWLFDPEHVNRLRTLLSDNHFAAAAKVYFDVVALAFDNEFDIAMVKALAHMRISFFGVRSFSVEQFTSAPQISLEAIRALGETFPGKCEAAPSLDAISQMLEWSQRCPKSAAKVPARESGGR